jgi:hypothetical protein
MRIIARSRIGFWTAFETTEGAFLNVRDEAGRTVSVILADADVALLADVAEICHPHARRLAEAGRRLDIALPTPLRGTQEPEPHEWQPTRPITTFEMLKAA